VKNQIFTEDRDKKTGGSGNGLAVDPYLPPVTSTDELPNDNSR